MVAFKKMVSQVDKVLEPAFRPFERLIFFYLLCVFIVLIGATFTVWDRFMQVEQQQTEYTQSLKYWEEVLSEHPDIADAHYNAAVYAYRLGYRDRAREYLYKALSQDPLFLEAKLLLAEIEGS